MKEEKNFYERLAALVKDDGYKGAALKTNVNAKSIENYAKGKGDPGLKNLLKIAHGYGVRVGWLADGEEPSEISETQNGGVDLRTVAAVQGHKSISMTMRYTHLLDGYKKEAIDKIAHLGL